MTLNLCVKYDKRNQNSVGEPGFLEPVGFMPLLAGTCCLSRYLQAPQVAHAWRSESVEPTVSISITCPAFRTGT